MFKVKMRVGVRVQAKMRVNAGVWEYGLIERVNVRVPRFINEGFFIYG